MDNKLTSKLLGYEQLLTELKERIRTCQVKAALSVNQELVLLYWHIGREILNRQDKQGWGTKVIERLSADLRSEFPQMKGFSSRNLKYMQAIVLAYHDSEFVQQVVAQIPWGHNLVILDKLQLLEGREWYIRATIEHGWSRNVLVMQIESGLYQRQGKAITNFERSLPHPQSDLAREMIKDPYNFDFLMLSQDAKERELEQGLLEHVRHFLLELGVGFAFIGSQYHLKVGDEDFYLDLLFYHYKLHCFMVIELKMGKFQPAFAGQMNFYLTAIDELLREPTDQPSIGIILCKEKNEIVAEYSLRDMSKPIGVSGYRITESLPDELKDSLPTIEDLEATFGGRNNE